MPIYTCIPSSGNAPTHPLFEQRGIKAYTAAPLSQVHLATLVSSTELAYAAYRTNIDSFVAATTCGNRLSTIKTGYDFLSNRVDVLPPFGTYPVVFTFKDPKKQDFVDAFVKKFAENRVADEMIGKTKVLIAYSPTVDFLNTIGKFVKPNASSRVDTIEFGAFRWISHIWRVIVNFLKTNTYPAYMDFKPFGIEGHETDSTIASTFDVIEELGATSRKAVYDDIKSMHVRVDDDEEEDEDADKNDEMELDEHVLSAIKDSVVHAKPSPMPESFNMGPASSVPNLPGQFFPYFQGMILGDKVTIKTIMSRHFMRLFGSTTSDIKSNYVAFRQEIESLTHSALGLQLGHILFGIDLTLQTQTRMYLIVEDSRYHGFVLLGARFNIHNGRNWVGPEIPSKLQQDFASIGNHASAIRTIVSLCSKMKISEGAVIKEKVTGQMISTPSTLADILVSREWTKEAKDEIEKALRNIWWPNAEYRSITLANVKWAIDLLSSPEKPLPEDLHFYIPNKGFDVASDREYRILAAFGPSSFSFQNQKGTTFKIVDPDTADPADVIDEKTTKKAMPHMLMLYKPTPIAYQDWKKTKRTRAIVIDLRERAQAHRNFYVAPANRDDLWLTLKRAFAKMNISDKKRKRDDKDGEGSGKGKKKKSDVEEDEELDYADLLA